MFVLLSINALGAHIIQGDLIFGQGSKISSFGLVSGNDWAHIIVLQMLEEILSHMWQDWKVQCDTKMIMEDR